MLTALTANDVMNHFTGHGPSAILGPGMQDFQTLDRNHDGRITDDDISDAKEMLECLDKIVNVNPFMADEYAASRVRLREALKSVD